MDVLGARFPDLASATAARDAILASVAMAPADVGVRPLGTTRYDDPIDAFLLAGRFATGTTEIVVRIVRDHGGAVISRRTEWRPSGLPGSHGSTPQRPALSRPWTGPRKRPRRPVTQRRVRAAADRHLSA